MSEQDRRGHDAPAGHPSATVGESEHGMESADFEQPGEPACWAHLVCPECGAMISEGHRGGCDWNARTGVRDSGD